MDDLQSKISQIMSDPEAVEQIRSLGNMLGLSQNSQNTAVNPPKPSPPISENRAQNQQLSALNGDTLSGIAKMMPVLSSMKQEDEATRLLSALRPFLSEEKQKKLDEAKKMLRFLKVLPLLKNGGLF
ncbi:MAG: hypothetical protein PUB41_03120 [bacterium]|nr:hypothetical protein [bacterium]